jgi:hypothetical protein
MSRSNILLFSLAFLAFFCSQSMAFPNLLRNTIMNAHATSSGIIDLQKDYYGQFYVEADFSYYWGASNSSKGSNSTNSTAGNSTVNGTTGSGRMMISTVNTDTMVAYSCLNFYYYDCSSSSCTKLSYTKSIDYPTFSANVQYAQSSMYLDYNYWSLSNSNYLYIANSCSSSGSNIGSNTYGVLGLGTGNGGSSNFGYSPIFSIYINSGMTGGKLLFKSDTSSYASSSNYVQSFYANSTWQISASSSYLYVGSYSVSMSSANVMFDMNSNAIGLPQTYYNNFLTYFGYQANVYCYSGYNSRPYCYYRGDLKNLPDITLSISGSKITIPSAIYATYSSSSSSYTYFYLNFKATSPYLSGVNYVSPSFANSIILDANFMSYYYVVFDAQYGSNYIYLYPSINRTGSNPAGWVAGGAVLAILFISICCCCAKKKRGVVSTAVATAAPLNNNTFNNTTQVVYTQPGVVTTVPNYSYDANQYNYPGYSAQPQGGVYQPYPVQPQGGVYQPYPAQPQGYIPPSNYQESAK